MPSSTCNRPPHGPVYAKQRGPLEAVCQSRPAEKTLGWLPLANAARLKAMLEQTGAHVDHRIVAGGHEFSHEDVVLARDWLHAQETAFPAAFRSNNEVTS